jgi:hypothetical protein
VARPGAVPPAHDTPYGARSPHWPWGQPGRYFDRAGDRRSAGAAPRALPPASDLLCPLSRLTVGSHPPTPGGSQLAFARDDVSTPIRPVTGRPSLPPPSFTRRPVGSPCGWPTLAGGRRAYHVASQEPSWVRPRLDAGGSSSAPDESEASGPGHSPFGPSLSAPLACRYERRLRRFTWVGHTTRPWSPTATVLVVAASARAPVAIPTDEDTLSRGLHTPPLPATHASVGDCWQNSRCRHLLCGRATQFLRYPRVALRRITINGADDATSRN